jgi:excisionase family DNA binding protein
VTDHPTIPEYLTVEEVASKLRMRKETVRQEIAELNLPATKVKGKWLIDTEDVVSYLEARKVTCIQTAKRVTSRNAQSDSTAFGEMARSMGGRGRDAALENPEYKKAG